MNGAELDVTDTSITAARPCPRGAAAEVPPTRRLLPRLPPSGVFFTPSVSRGSSAPPPSAAMRDGRDLSGHLRGKRKNQMPILLARGVNLVRARGNTIGVLQQRRTIVF